MSKKISLGMCIALIALTATATFSIGYMAAENKMSKIISSISDRQVMYDKLNEIDTAIRKHYTSTVESNSLNEGICKGYVEGLNNSQAKYLSATEYTLYNAMLNVANTAKGEIIDNDIGYITLTSFSSETRNELNSVINSLKEQGASSFIINIRDVSCINIEYACDAADLFVDDSIIAYSIIDGNIKEAFLGNSDYINEKLVILVNENTSGAGEIFASALRDDLLIPIIGITTAGKTAICTVAPLKDGSAVIIPNGEYTTQSKNSINNIGLVPDYEVYSSYVSDLQLQKAIEVLRAE